MQPMLDARHACICGTLPLPCSGWVQCHLQRIGRAAACPAAAASVVLIQTSVAQHAANLRLTLYADLPC